MNAKEAVTYFVRYRGVPQPQDDFVAYYRERHAQILLEWPGIIRLVLHVPTSWHDPFPIEADETDFLAEMTFANDDALALALQSKARAAARADLANVTRGRPIAVTHQAMRSLRVI